MLRAHQQAWAWQDEWWGLGIDDIRAIEEETMAVLQRKYASEEEQEEEGGSLPERDNDASELNGNTVTPAADGSSDPATTRARITSVNSDGNRSAVSVRVSPYCGVPCYYYGYTNMLYRTFWLIVTSSLIPSISFW